MTMADRLRQEGRQEVAQKLQQEGCSQELIDRVTGMELSETEQRESLS